MLQETTGSLFAPERPVLAVASQVGSAAAAQPPEDAYCSSAATGISWRGAITLQHEQEKL